MIGLVEHLCDPVNRDIVLAFIRAGDSIDEVRRAMRRLARTVEQMDALIRELDKPPARTLDQLLDLNHVPAPAVIGTSLDSRKPRHLRPRSVCACRRARPPPRASTTAIY